MYDFIDKVVLVTGGANGIGAVTCIEVLKEGAKHVRIVDIDEAAGIKLQYELNEEYGENKAKFVKCDVTNDDELFSALSDTKEEESCLDVVFNNAGVAAETDYASIRKQIQINLIALVNGTLKAVEIMDKTKGGRGGTVVNTSSIAGMFPACPPLFVYSCTKSAVLQFTSCIGNEAFYNETGVRVLAVCFGVTDTNILGRMLTFDGRGQEDVTNIVSGHGKQSVESAARGSIESYKRGKTGSVWLMHGDKPALDFTESRDKCNAEMIKLLMD